MWTILEQAFATERVHRRASTTDFARPVFHERSLPPEAAPVVVTNAKRSFVSVAPSAAGFVRAGFSDVAPEEEEDLLSGLFKTLWDLSVARQWANRCTTLQEATTKLGTLGFEAKCVISSPELLREAVVNEEILDDASHPALGRGYVTEVNGIRVLISKGLPSGTAFVLTLPSLVGSYIRTDQHLALLVYRADRALVLVQRSDEQEQCSGLNSLSRLPISS